MRQLLAAVLLVVGVFGAMGLWLDVRRPADVEVDEVAVNHKVDRRLHQVLSGMLERERAERALLVHR